jgi:hypothetical protein
LEEPSDDEIAGLGHPAAVAMMRLETVPNFDASNIEP